MIRGTTPRLVFNLPIPASKLAEAYITIMQGTRVAFEKTLQDCTVGPSYIAFNLTQEETLSLELKPPLEIQIRARLLDGNAVASNIMSASVERILKDGVI